MDFFNIFLKLEGMFIMLYSYIEEDFNPSRVGKVNSKYYVYVQKEKVYVDYEIYLLYRTEAYRNKREKKEMKNNNFVVIGLSDISENDTPISRKDADLFDNLSINIALSTLDIAERKLIFFIYYYGYSQDDVAKKLAVSQSTISYRLKCILFKLRKKLLAS